MTIFCLCLLNLEKTTFDEDEKKKKKNSNHEKVLRVGPIL